MIICSDISYITSPALIKCTVVAPLVTHHISVHLSQDGAAVSPFMMWCTGDYVFSICCFTFCAQWGRSWKVQISVIVIITSGHHCLSSICFTITSLLVYLCFVVVFILLRLVCTLNIFVFCTDCSPVASYLQDDVDVEDDMTIREVRQTHSHTTD